MHVIPVHMCHDIACLRQDDAAAAGGSLKPQGSGARRSLEIPVAQQDVWGTSTARNPAGDVAASPRLVLEQGPAVAASRPQPPGPRSQLGPSSWLLASPASSVEDWLADLPMPSPPTSEPASGTALQWAAGHADSASRTEADGLPHEAAEPTMQPSSRSNGGVRQPSHDGDCSGTGPPEATPDGATASRASSEPLSDLTRRGRKEGAAAGRLRGEDRLEALAAVLAAVEAGASGDGASRCGYLTSCGIGRHLILE